MSRNAIKGSMPINGIDAEQESIRVISLLKTQIGIDAVTLGSTGKKSVEEFSGDIDIAIQMPFTSENISLIEDFLKKNFGEDVQIYVSHGFKIISFGLKYGLFMDGYVQVDLMFSNDLEYSKFMYHSPNYRKHESIFKGLYRTNLLIYVAGRIPTGIENVYDDNGNLMDYWKYTLTYDTGLKLVHKTYRGKTKRLSTPVTVKEDSIPVTKDINEIIKYCLGPDATIADVNSFESLITYLFSDKYIYDNHVLFNILDDYFEDERQKSMQNELLQYIFKKKCIIIKIKYDDNLKEFLKNLL